VIPTSSTWGEERRKASATISSAATSVSTSMTRGAGTAVVPGVEVAAALSAGALSAGRTEGAALGGVAEQAARTSATSVDPSRTAGDRIVKVPPWAYPYGGRRRPVRSNVHAA
jgi:hypothetical protein